jgi:acetyltransferase
VRPYPARLETTLSLADGSRVAVRPIRPDDAERETRFVRGLSEQSRFQRFMHAVTDLSPGMLERFLHPDYDRELALVALQGNSFVAVARYAGTPEPGVAEFALVVDDAWQRKGLGRALLRMLVDEAARAGYRSLSGTILDSNQAMIELARSLGFVPTGRDGAALVLSAPLIRGAQGPT